MRTLAPIARVFQTPVLLADKGVLRARFKPALESSGFETEIVRDEDDAVLRLQTGRRFLALVLEEPSLSARDLKGITTEYPEFPLFLVSECSIKAFPGHSAASYDVEILRNVLESALASTPLALPFGIGSPAEADRYRLFVGTSPYMRRLQSVLPQIAASDSPVLIQGETGTGKEVIAREIHALSPRAGGPILKLNCAALPFELIESELFGYERGAFTGAFQRKPGMFELADGGTILLDEIGDMDIRLQAKLLQVLQDNDFHRLGGSETVHVDVRVIAATHRDLEKAIAEDRFREDLYYRLNVINVRVPPLRSRKQDVIPLAEILMRRHWSANRPAPVVTSALANLLLEYDWPGNIRELENIIRKYQVFQDLDIIREDLRLGRRASGSAGVLNASPSELPVPPTIVPPLEPLPDPEESILDQVARTKSIAERAAIVAALSATNWNRRQAAARLRVDYKALLYKMKKLSIRKGAPDERKPKTFATGA